MANYPANNQSDHEPEKHGAPFDSIAPTPAHRRECDAIRKKLAKQRAKGATGSKPTPIKGLVNGDPED